MVILHLILSPLGKEGKRRRGHRHPFFFPFRRKKDGYGYFVAVSPNLDYQVAYLYDEDYGDLDIYGSVNCKFADAAMVQSKLAEYYANLKTLGFTLFDTVGEEETDRYLSPEGDYVVSAEVMDYEGYSVLTVYFDNIVEGQI